MQEKYYRDKLYPLQNKVLRTIEKLGLDFYLTGGTALGRCYLNHRYSDDLDFFTNDNQAFKEQCKIAIDTLKAKWPLNVATTTASFVRVFVEAGEQIVKVDFVNDVPAHFGVIVKSKIFNRIDSWRNILSNKLCALSRLEAKDFADIVFIANTYSFNWEKILSEAKEKDLWVAPKTVHVSLCLLAD